MENRSGRGKTKAFLTLITNHSKLTLCFPLPTKMIDFGVSVERSDLFENFPSGYTCHLRLVPLQIRPRIRETYFSAVVSPFHPEDVLTIRLFWPKDAEKRLNICTSNLPCTGQV